MPRKASAPTRDEFQRLQDDFARLRQQFDALQYTFEEQSKDLFTRILKARSENEPSER